jgi:hypothetical protein
MKRWVLLSFLSVACVSGAVVWFTVKSSAAVETTAVWADRITVPAHRPAASAPAGVTATNDMHKPHEASPSNGPKLTDRFVWDLCGIGRLPIPQAALAVAQGGLAELPKHLGETAHEQGRDALWRALAAGDARARAAALLWRATARGVTVGLPAPAQPIVSEATEAFKAALLQLAEEQSDALIASWAVKACGGDRACRQRAADVWLRVDPVNAAALLPALALYPERKQQLAAAIAGSMQFNSYYGALAGKVLVAMPNEVPPYVQQGLLVEVLGLDSTFGISELSSLLALCNPAPAVGSAEQSRCAAIASLLVARSDTLLTHNVGSRMGELAGWPKEQEEARRAHATGGLSMFTFFEQPMSCAAIESSRAWVRDMASKGEMATLRERAAAAKLKQ